MNNVHQLGVRSGHTDMIGDAAIMGQPFESVSLCHSVAASPPYLCIIVTSAPNDLTMRDCHGIKPEERSSPV